MLLLDDEIDVCPTDSAARTRDALSGRAFRFDDGDAIVEAADEEDEDEDEEAIAARSALLCGSRDCSAERAAACNTSASMRFESDAAAPLPRPAALLKEEDTFDDAILAEPTDVLVGFETVAARGCGETSC